MAAPESGTRCGFPFFIRSPGMIHVAAVRSISTQVAPRACLDLAAVWIRNRIHRRGRERRDVGFDSLYGVRHFPEVKAARKLSFTFGMVGQRRLYSVAGYVFPDVSGCPAMVQDRTNTLPDPSGRFRLFGPDRFQGVQNVLLCNSVYRYIAEIRERVFRQDPDPVPCMLGRSESRRKGLVRFGRGNPEGSGFSRGVSQVTGYGRPLWPGDFRKPDPAPYATTRPGNEPRPISWRAPVDQYPLNPGPAARLFDMQVQRFVGAVKAGFVIDRHSAAVIFLIATPVRLVRILSGVEPVRFYPTMNPNKINGNLRQFVQTCNNYKTNRNAYGTGVLGTHGKA